ncbi:MAG TPA: hypothetical protein VI364_03790, partial [Actinomycetota bacterium]
YDRFGEIWRSLHPGEVGADAIDAQLHGERVEPRTLGHRLHKADLADLPDGAFVLRAGVPLLVLGSELLRWSTAGYVERDPRPARSGTTLITPPSLVEVLRAGWHPVVPLFHPSAAPDHLDPA